MMGAMDPITLRNRLLVATGMWKEATGEPLPKLAPGDPVDQIQSFELHLINRLWENATPETAREVADLTWDLVHDRDDDDVVKRRVVECHEALAREHGNRADQPAHAPPAHHVSRDSRQLLNVGFGAGRQVAEHDLLGDSAPQRNLDLPQKMALVEVEPVGVRGREGHAEGLAAG